MKTLFSAAVAAIFSLTSVSAATAELSTSIAPVAATVLAAATTTLNG